MKCGACRWCTTKAPAGPFSQLAHGWAALGVLLLQILTSHQSTIPEGPVRDALDIILAEALQMLSRPNSAHDRYVMMSRLKASAFAMACIHAGNQLLITFYVMHQQKAS